MRRLAAERAERLRGVFAELAGMSARKAAEELNRRGIEAPAGGKWFAMQAGGKWFAMQVIRIRARLAPIGRS